jgi:MerR family transcriptional regulator, light-induced transcriptional regulator
MVGDQGYSIKVAVQKTGLTPHVIRIWEKRYGAVAPSRTPTKRRRYNEAEIQRLLLLRQATQAGYSIGQIAHLPNDKLRELSDTATSVLAMPLPAPSPAATTSGLAHLDACLRATERLDAADLEATLIRARVTLSQAAFIETLVVPLIQQIGELWRDGTLRIVHEHLASAVIRTLLGSLVITSNVPLTAPHLIVSTPVGQLHEIGALIAAAVASTEGWGVTYLGADLPAEDITAAVQQHHARAVALSIVYPPDNFHLTQELVRLHRYLSPEVRLFVSGRAAGHYEEVLQSIGAIRPHSWADFRSQLETVRTGAWCIRE